jgi:hypothetical protein
MMRVTSARTTTVRTSAPGTPVAASQWIPYVPLAAVVKVRAQKPNPNGNRAYVGIKAS